MKCPKCGYISFDYNQRCPKCNKDLGPEQKKRNLVVFKHNPPFFLGSLTGEANNVDVPPSAGMEDDFGALEGEDLDMHLDAEGSLETGAAVEDVSLDLEDLSGNMAESDDLGDLSFTEEPSETGASQEGAPPDESEMVTTEIEQKKAPASEDLIDLDLELD
jgi:hypothetical protein